MCSLNLFIIRVLDQRYQRGPTTQEMGRGEKNYTYSFLCVRYRQVYYSSFVSEEILTETDIPGGGGIKTEAILKVTCVVAKCVYYPCFGSKEIPGGDRGRRRRGERETILYKFCVCLLNMLIIRFCCCCCCCCCIFVVVYT